MRTVNEAERETKAADIMERCFECYAEYGLGAVGIKTLAEACGISSGTLYFYFRDLDDLIIRSTAYCMQKVEDEFMEKAPADARDIWRFIEEIPYWTAEKHGRKYRLMYQVYTHPKYRVYGQQFFEGVNRRYTEYAKLLESKIGIPYQKITSLIFVFVRACVHYALFEDEFYLNRQLDALKDSVKYSLQQSGGNMVFPE